MKIVVFSDSHGDFGALSRVLDAKPGVEMFLHCGDGADEASDLQNLHPEKIVRFVRGNCDWTAGVKLEELMTVAGKRILVTHGHVHGVKQGLDKLVSHASELGADIACFGHTHLPLHTKVGDLHLVNPGSVGNPSRGSKPTYAIVKISGEGIAVEIVEL